MHYTIWHNPSCSKSRATLALLASHGIQPTVVDYRTEPPTAALIADTIRALGIEPVQLVRRADALKAGVGDSLDADIDGIAALLEAHPELIERPVVLRSDGRAAIGRPPENVLALL